MIIMIIIIILTKFKPLKGENKNKKYELYQSWNV